MTSPSILLLHRHPPENAGGIDAIERAIKKNLTESNLDRAYDYESAMRKISDAEIVIEHRIDEELLEEGRNIRWIQSLTAGYDHYDLDALRDREITLTTASGVHRNPVAQHVLGYILTFERGLLQARKQQNNRVWNRYAPSEPTDKTAGIIGLGSIGTKVAELLDAIGMRVIGTKRDTSDPVRHVHELHGADDFHTVVGRSDYVIATCPLNSQTRELFDARAFTSMKSDAILINVARGEVIDQPALIEALQTGNIGGAALDVAYNEPLDNQSPLWDMDNVIVTPHLAGGSQKFGERCADIFHTNLECYKAGAHDEMINRVV